jgi:hypothetical protein
MWKCRLKGGEDEMAQETRPTNERIVVLLETISRQLSELQDAQKRIATELSQAIKAGR